MVPGARRFTGPSISALRKATRACRETDWQDLVLQTLRKAVEWRLVSDVPVGVLLSGGLDSSIIVALLAEAGQHGLQTFSIGFETVGNEVGDEFQYSDIIAKRFETDHHKLFVDSSRTLPAASELRAAMAEPMVSHDAIGFYLLSQEVAKHVKVVRAGRAPTIFGGYHWYPPMMESRDPVSDYARVFFDRDQAEMAQVLDPRMLGEDYSRLFVERHFAQPGADRPIDKALRLDTNDDAGGRSGEAGGRYDDGLGSGRAVPFLDHESGRIGGAGSAGTEDRRGRQIRAEGSRPPGVPSEVIDRPKGYFPMPAPKYSRAPT